MSLYEQWLTKAYNKDGDSNKTLWDDYLPKEQKIYEEILEHKINKVTGTVKELSARFHMSTEYICGFIDGINEAVETPIVIDQLTEDTYVELQLDFKKLYKKMVEYKAEHLYTLPQWEHIFTEEERQALYYEQKTSRTVVKGEKVGRNDPCPCGSGKKYKKCCGLNK